MAVPQFLSSDFGYRKITGITDVQTIIDDLYIDLLALGWTCTVGGSGISPTTYLSPARADRSRFSLTLTRTSQAILTIRMIDDLGLIVSVTDREVRIDTGGGKNVHLFTGETHCYIHSNTGGAPVNSHTAMFGILDNEPYDTLDDPFPAYFSSTTTLVAYDWEPHKFNILNPDTYAYEEQIALYRKWSNWFTDQAAVSLSGSYLCVPADIQYPTGIYYGRLPQMVVIDPVLHTDEVERTFPIDTGVTGVFVSLHADSYRRLAARKS